jgi:hypothetical protein
MQMRRAATLGSVRGVIAQFNLHAAVASLNRRIRGRDRDSQSFTWEARDGSEHQEDRARMDIVYGSPEIIVSASGGRDRVG